MPSTAVLLSSSLASHTSSSRTLLSILLVVAFSTGFAQQSPPSAAGSLDEQAFSSTVDSSQTYLANLSEVTAFPGKSSRQKKRTWIIAGVHTVGYGGSLVLLSSAWYKGYERTGFHTFNDSREWQQMDKVGHAWGAYNISKVSSAMWKWTGMPEKQAVILGGAGSIAYLTAIEFLDAYSAKWGWSWSDIAANMGGAGLFAVQELAWKEQRIQFKFSFHKKEYGEPALAERADDLFGKPWYERMLKDYNAQTYWFSFDIQSFFPGSKWPDWLNLAVGYGADGMYGGFENKWTDKQGNAMDRTDIARTRQFYLAPDIDFTKIKTNKKWLRTAFTFLNAFKCPSPALMIDSKGKWKAYAMYF